MVVFYCVFVRYLCVFVVYVSERMFKYGGMHVLHCIYVYSALTFPNILTGVFLAARWRKVA